MKKIAASVLVALFMIAGTAFANYRSKPAITQPDTSMMKSSKGMKKMSSTKSMKMKKSSKSSTMKKSSNSMMMKKSSKSMKMKSAKKDSTMMQKKMMKDKGSQKSMN